MVTRERFSPDLLPHVKPIAFAIEDPDNAMTHPEENLVEIGESLRAHGQVKPVVYWRNDQGEPRVIAGNGTLRAAKNLGWNNLAMVEYLGTREEAMAYALADNHASELARWDIAKRDLQLAALGLRWNPVKVDWKPVEPKFEAPKTIVSPTREPKPSRAEVPSEHVSAAETPTGRVSRGDLWILGRHKVLCAPAVDAQAVRALLAGGQSTLRYVTAAPDREPRWWASTGLGASWSPYWPGWEPLRQALNGERQKAHWSNEDVCRATHDARAARWFDAGDFWEPIPREAYETLQAVGKDEGVFTHPYEALLAVIAKLQDAQDHDFRYLEPLFSAAEGPILVLGSALPAALVAAEHTGKHCFGALPTPEACGQAISFFETQTGLTAEKA